MNDVIWSKYTAEILTSLDSYLGRYVCINMHVKSSFYTTSLYMLCKREIERICLPSVFIHQRHR